MSLKIAYRKFHSNLHWTNELNILCRIEETCNLWQRYIEDANRFEGWLREREREARVPLTENVTITMAKEECKKYESFQKKIHDNLEKLDALNQQYRRLAREGLTDTSGQLKTQIYDINSRWDDLNERAHAILRRLRHMIDVYDDYQAERERLLLWLGEMDKRVGRLEDTAAKGKPVSEDHIQVNGEEFEIEIKNIVFIVVC